jgi:putative oxidoreductase
LLFGFKHVSQLWSWIFSILTAFLFHQGGADAAAQYNNGIHFMKNLAMAGGLFS